MPPRHLLAIATLLALCSAAARAAPGSTTPAGYVDATVHQAERERLGQQIQQLQQALDSARAAQQAAEKAAKVRPSGVSSEQWQAAQTELAEARKRITALEGKLVEAERQRDDARSAAQRADQRAQAAARPSADPDPALRRERDQLKTERDTLKTDLTQARQALSALQARQASAPGPQTVQPAASAALADGALLRVPGCGAACPTFVLLPQAGRVTLGTGGEATTVDFKYRIAMGQTEITVAQWKHFMDDSRYQLPSNSTTYCHWKSEAVSDQHPVRCVSAEDAEAYARWFLGKYAAQLHPQVKELRLPNSDEWEYAARAGRWTQERQWDGNEKEDCRYAGSAKCTGSTPDPVAKTGRLPNAWGLYDMIGNVWEVTATPGGLGRVFRGGSFRSNGDYLRLSARVTNTSGWRSNDNGFRLLARIDL